MNKFYLFLALPVVECEDTIESEDCDANIEDCAGECDGDAYPLANIMI